MESNWRPACSTPLPSISDCSTPQSTPFTPSPDRRFQPQAKLSLYPSNQTTPKNMKYTPRHSRLVAVLVAAISACATIQAQTAPSPAQPASTTTTTTTTTDASKDEARSEEHTSELQSLRHLVCRL